MYNKRETSHSYLSSIDTGPLLTKSQELELIKQVEVFQHEILQYLLKLTFSKSILKSYLTKLNATEESISDISKNLDDESSKSERVKVLTSFTKFVDGLESLSYDELSKLAESINLTGTIIHGVASEIKQINNDLTNAISNYQNILKYFDKETESEIYQLIKSDNVELRLRLKLEFNLNDTKLSLKLNEWKSVLSTLDSVKSSLNVHNLDEINKAFKHIIKLEEQASFYKNQLITKNLRLVVSRAKKFTNKGLDFEDLIQEGNIGLMTAVDKFDSSKKTKISTYATWWIDQNIRRAISNKGKTVRMPTHMEWMETKINQAAYKLQGQLKRPPTLKEIAAATKYTLSAIEDLYSRPHFEVGMDEELASGASLSDMLSADPFENPSLLVEQKMSKERVREVLSTLDPKSEMIIRLRFGIGDLPDSEGMSLQEIASDIGLTRQGARVRTCKALNNLRKLKGALNG